VGGGLLKSLGGNGALTGARPPKPGGEVIVPVVNGVRVFKVGLGQLPAKICVFF